MNKKEKTKLQCCQEAERMIERGMNNISPAALESRLNSIGYYIDKDKCFNYQNDLNGTVGYPARHIAISHKASRKSFSNVESPKATYPQLKEMRATLFVWHAGRIWEI